MKTFNVVKKIGLGVSLGLASSLSMADSLYNLDEFGLGSYVAEGVTTSYGSSDAISNLGTFTDIFTFTVSGEYVSDLSVSIYAPGPGIQFTDIEFTDIEFQEVTGSVWSDAEYEYEPHGDGKILISAYSSADIESMDLTPGFYSFSVSGTSDGVGSTYDWSVSLSSALISPVPEPSSIALMLGGLGLVGFMAARRRKMSLENS